MLVGQLPALPATAQAAQQAQAGRPATAARAPHRTHRPARAPHGKGTTDDAPASAAPRIFTGLGFDTCTAPSLDDLKVWRRSSPYGAIGVYIGGRNRACAQPRLTAGWVRSATAQGWGVLPLYVGSQAPCLDPGPTSARSSRIDPRRATATGSADGADAARAAGALGLASSSPVYLDMEAYTRTGSSCSTAVMQYTAAWSKAVRAAGFLAGFYSANAGIADLSAVALQRGESSPAVADVVWYARWDARARTDGYGVLRRGLWADHRRVHQYQGNVEEKHGGVTLQIDRNAVDAPVAVVRSASTRARRRQLR
ncbi:DUF1906 domain-containing protein [Streptacidiphilus sp. PB12-B1b]|nr:DUF1906 domain-containing protein [Streptacidiphilus sp. PB12-B1b]